MDRTLLYLVKLRQYETPALEHAARADSDNASLEPAFKSHLRWYLIQCRARQDKRALDNLQRQGFECYRPVYETERIRRGRKHLTSAALFPGFLFIRLDALGSIFRPCRNTFHGRPKKHHTEDSLALKTSSGNLPQSGDMTPPVPAGPPADTLDSHTSFPRSPRREVACPPFRAAST
jgi:hypothetical protein